jgi:trans-2,3-dihydro-3-hydroxyanthranilate isomerase
MIGSGPLLPVDYIVCDVFTQAGLSGNQLAVFPDGPRLSPALQLALAREMNYSESVFIGPADGDADARLSIYTPVGEIPFAGHPVLGTAAALANAVDRDLVLETGAGPISVSVRGAGPALAEVWMAQPWPGQFELDAQAVRRGLRLREDVPVAAYANGARYALVGLPSRADVAGLSPDFEILRGLDHAVLCFAGRGLAWKVRMFAPGLGVSEDPATGSAAGPLAVHLRSLGLLGPRDTIHIEQGAEIGRPSSLRARLGANANGEPTISVGGHAVIVARGTFWLRPEDFR